MYQPPKVSATTNSVPGGTACPAQSWKRLGGRLAASVELTYVRTGSPISVVDASAGTPSAGGDWAASARGSSLAPVVGAHPNPLEGHNWAFGARRTNRFTPGPPHS